MTEDLRIIVTMLTMKILKTMNKTITYHNSMKELNIAIDSLKKGKSADSSHPTHFHT